MENRVLSVSLALIATLILTSSPSVSAQQVKSKEICDKFKACLLESLEGQDLLDEMKQMVLSQLDQCVVTFEEKEQEYADADLLDEANACSDEMIEIPCDKLMMHNAAKETKACKELEQAAQQAGIE